MSRLLIVIFVMTNLSCGAVQAMDLTDAQIKAIIDRQRQTISIDADGCLKNPNDEKDIIIVCGEAEENKRQKLPIKSAPSEDILRRGEAVSTRRAAAKDNRNCGVIGTGLGCIELPKNWIKSDAGPEPAILFSEVIKGLPEPDQVVSEDATQKPR
jgi:hypothetical protein